MIRVLIGNIFDSRMHTLVNTVNCVGVMGKGVAKEFKLRFPQMYLDYVERCKKKQVKLGYPYIYKDLLGISIVNFPTKEHWRSPSRFEDIVNGLRYFSSKYKEWGILSVAFPPLGCGNGGLDWRDIGPILYQCLSKLEIPVEIYAPYGTKTEYLTTDFLKRKVPLDKSSINHAVQNHVKPEWVCLLEVIRQLQTKKFAQPIGRTKYQKLCYALTDVGIPMGFNFVQGSYGPYSLEAKRAIGILANANLVVEQQKGQMTAMLVGPDYSTFRKAHIHVLKQYQPEISKTLDLFCRITNTEQSEEVATVLFTTRQLERQTQTKLDEKDVFDKVIEWKKQWDTQGKRNNVAIAIRNLLILDWIKIKASDDLPIQDHLYCEEFA